jgi:hypothetical protein
MKSVGWISKRVVNTGAWDMGIIRHRRWRLAGAVAFATMMSD